MGRTSETRSRCQLTIETLTRLMRGAGNEPFGGELVRGWARRGWLAQLQPCPGDGLHILVEGGEALCSHHGIPPDATEATRTVCDIVLGRGITNGRTACYSEQYRRYLQALGPAAADSRESAGRRPRRRRPCPHGGSYNIDDDGVTICTLHGQADVQPLFKPGTPNIIHLPSLWIALTGMTALVG